MMKLYRFQRVNGVLRQTLSLLLKRQYTNLMSFATIHLPNNSIPDSVVRDRQQQGGQIKSETTTVSQHPSPTEQLRAVNVYELDNERLSDSGKTHFLISSEAGVALPSPRPVTLPGK